MSRREAWTGLEEIDRVGPGGNYLTADLTLAQFRQAAFESPVFPRLSLDGWRAGGRPQADDLLRQHTLERMANARVPPDRQEITEHGTALIDRLRAKA